MAEKFDAAKGVLREFGQLELSDGTKIKGVFVELDKAPAWPWVAIFDNWHVEISLIEKSEKF